MKKRKPKIIKNKKLRGEWAESVFMARAGEHGLTVSKPWGESSSYDFVVGRPGHFVGVQVKSTMGESRRGYACFIRKQHKTYARGSFDFVAAYVVPKDAWYIIPAREIKGRTSMELCSNSKYAKYEKYREAWHLLREASEIGEEAETSAEEMAPPATPPGRFPTNALGRMEAVASFVRRQLEGRNVDATKRSDDL